VSGSTVADRRGSAGVLAELNKASSAEDFFALLGVAYDAKIVNVARLHILRRMAQYLASEDFTDVADAIVGERCKAVLERAYGDFVVSTPIDQRLFKVHKDAVASTTPKPPSLVQLAMLK
jgi:nitrogenase-stabilizing/protective protein